MAEYSPELGQMVFGQPFKQYEVPPIMEAALEFLRHELARVMWNIHQKDTADPFGNSGPDGNYSSDVFSVQAYSWGDDDQPWNFKCGDLEISWYKYCGRGMSANIEVTPDLASQILIKCLEHLRKIDEEGYEKLLSEG